MDPVGARRPVSWTRTYPQRAGALVPAETHIDRPPLDRQGVFELIRDQLADILETDPADDHRDVLVRRGPERRLPGPDRAGRGPGGGARRADRGLPDRGRGPGGPPHGPRRGRLRGRQARSRLIEASPPRPSGGRPRAARPRRTSTAPPASRRWPDRLGHRFADPIAPAPGPRRTAAGAPSARGADSNERLEFLGDAVLGLVVAEHCYAAYPDFAEGQLAKVRSAVVNARVLAEVGRRPRRGRRCSCSARGRSPRAAGPRFRCSPTPPRP